jgi:HK97 family phage major capsid protein/HK97 family phage prohead protease
MSELKLPALARDMFGAEITARVSESGTAELTFAASSEIPVQRFFGEEVLSHAPGAIRMHRINGGAAPLLFNHNWDDPIGMVTAGRIEGGRMIVDANLFDTVRGKEVRAMLEGGLKNVSIGYEINAMTEDKARGSFTATDWMPLEVSIVTIPADPSVGIGRSQDQITKPVQIRTVTPPESRDSITLKGAIMAEAIETPAGQTADNFNPAEIEGQRKQAIQNICRANKIDERIERNWIESGAGFSEVSQGILDVLKTRGETNPQSVAKLDMSSNDVRRYSVLRAIRAAATNDWKNAGLEFEAHKAIMARSGRSPEQRGGFFVPFDVQSRDMTAAGTSGSNYLVSTDNQPGSFIELLRNRSVTMAMGVTRLSGLVGNVTIPKQTAGATAYWLADETTSITESQATLGQLSLSAKNVAALTEVSEQLMRQSSPDAEQLVMSDLAKQIALAVDVAIIRGAGSGGQPQGIVGTSGVGSVTGTSLAFADILEFQSDIAANNALVAGCGYVTTPAVAALLAERVAFASTASPLWVGNILDGNMAGFRAMSSNQMSAATMLFGDFSQCILGEFGILELATHATDFAKGLTGIRAWYTCDVGVRVPGAFSYASSIT